MNTFSNHKQYLFKYIYLDEKRDHNRKIRRPCTDWSGPVSNRMDLYRTSLIGRRRSNVGSLSIVVYSMDNVSVSLIAHLSGLRMGIHLLHIPLVEYMVGNRTQRRLLTQKPTPGMRRSNQTKYDNYVVYALRIR